jgi:hypothetical protein
MLTNLRERVHGVLSFTTPHRQVLDDSVSWVITHVAAPPMDHVSHEQDDWLEVRAGGREAMRHPLRYLMDLYQRDMAPPIEHQRQIQEQLSMIMDMVLAKRAKLDTDLLRLIYRLQAQVNAQLKHTLDSRAYLGIRLMRAILVPPRQLIEARCTSGREVQVYLSGLLSRDVS